MWGARACRVLAGTAASSSQEGPKSRSQTARLTPEQRVQRWKVVTLKILLVLRNFHMKRSSQEILGKEAYQRIFNQVDRSERPLAADQVVHRVINGEVVGAEMKSGKKEATEDVMLCQHPTTAMKARGNKTEKWWTCTLCQSRWKRMPLKQSEGRATDTDVVTFGTKYVGRTYREVAEDKEYSEWILRTVETGDHQAYAGIRRLADYLVNRETKRTYTEVQAEDTMSDV